MRTAQERAAGGGEVAAEYHLRTVLPAGESHSSRTRGNGVALGSDGRLSVAVTRRRLWPYD